MILPMRAFATIAWNDEAGGATMDAFLLGYRVQSVLLIALGVVLLAIDAWLARHEIADALRASVRPRPGEAAPDWALLVQRNMAALRMIGLLGGAIALASWPEPNGRSYAIIVAFVAGWLVALWFIERPAAVEREALAESASTAPGLHHLPWLRAAGVIIPLLALVVLPGPAIEAVAVILIAALAYLAVVEWLGRPAAQEPTEIDSGVLPPMPGGVQRDFLGHVPAQRRDPNRR